MLAEKRRALILQVLAESGSVSVTELYRRLKVSRETIRRDITRLDGENRLRKTHGGALSVDAVEPALTERMAVNIDGKRAIGRAAAGLVADGASLIVDSGTTTLCLAEALVGRRRLQVYTNDLHVATRLAGRNDNRVFFLGGEFIGAEGITAGRDATAMLSNYFADFAFIGASTISSHPWLMDYSREAAELHASMIAQAKTAVVLADHTKFGRTAPVRVSNFERASRLITDVRPPASLARGLKTIGVELMVAGE